LATPEVHKQEKMQVAAPATIILQQAVTLRTKS